MDTLQLLAASTCLTSQYVSSVTSSGIEIHPEMNGAVHGFHWSTDICFDVD